ncbi:putative ABC-type xenobiotic transporter [Helianthus annuus]|nr:putative ABC-type xenobiotic transporter [Helianthus annuus]
MVNSYIGEKKMVSRLLDALIPTLALGIKQGLLKGIVFGSIRVIFSIFALMSWHESILVIKKGIKGGDIIASGVCIVRIIDSIDKHGKMILAVKGELEFKDVEFGYLSRPESLVLKRVNIKIKPCQTVGLVGQSGSDRGSDTTRWD